MFLLVWWQGSIRFCQKLCVPIGRSVGHRPDWREGMFADPHDRFVAMLFGSMVAAILFTKFVLI